MGRPSTMWYVSLRAREWIPYILLCLFNSHFLMKFISNILYLLKTSPVVEMQDVFLFIQMVMNMIMNNRSMPNCLIYNDNDKLEIIDKHVILIMINKKRVNYCYYYFHWYIFQVKFFIYINEKRNKLTKKRIDIK